MHFADTLTYAGPFLYNAAAFFPWAAFFAVGRTGVQIGWRAS
ncbi:MAG TPA: hypothetical protein VGJ21_15120 [Terracidiphilus sp.]|jgi:hypothetical protein